jgi:hypothetical protein
MKSSGACHPFLHKHTSHCVPKLVEIDLSIAVLVRLLHDLQPHFVVVAVERSFELICADFAVTVLIEHCEGSLQVLLVEQSDSVCSRLQELVVVQFAVFVRVKGIKNGAPVFVTAENVRNITLVLRHALLQLVISDEAVLVEVQLLE